MKKEYMKPEAEMMKFVEAEDLMASDASGVFNGYLDTGTNSGGVTGGTTDYIFP